MDRFFELVKTQADWNPSFISAKSLKTMGIAPSKEKATIACLDFLGIVNTQGVPTDNFQKLRNDFQPTLRRLVRSAYSEIFETVPASLITQEGLVRFFVESGYSKDTAEYQAVLLVWLCQQSGVDLPSAQATLPRSRFQTST